MDLEVTIQIMQWEDMESHVLNKLQTCSFSLSKEKKIKKYRVWNLTVKEIPPDQKGIKAHHL